MGSRHHRYPTMQDVASEAGVALSSVSRALSGHPDVSPAMVERVRDAAERLGYQPDILAQGLRSGMTKTVGFVVRDISNPLFAEIAKGVEDGLRKAGYSMLLTNSDGDVDMEADHVRVLQRRRVDGLIVSLVAEDEGPTVETLRQSPTPVVLLDRDVADIVASAVLVDHYTGTKAAVTRLLAIGHRRIGLITGSRLVRPARERLRGYVDAHHEAGVALTEALVRLDSFAEAYAQSAVAELLSLPEPPTALLAGGVQSTIGALLELNQRGIVPGYHMAFVACDDTPILELARPPLSVVSRDSRRMGQMAAELLLATLRDEQAQITAVPTRFIERTLQGP